MANKRFIRVDVLPNLSWTAQQLVDCAVQHRVTLTGCKHPKDALHLSKEKILELLYEQCEFEEFQSSLEEIKGQRSSVVLKEKQIEPEYSYKAKIIYVGNSSMCPIKWEGKSIFFIHGQVYSLPIEKKELVMFLRKRPDFQVTFDEVEQEDSLLFTMRQIKEEMQQQSLLERDDNDYGGIF